MDKSLSTDFTNFQKLGIAVLATKYPNITLDHKAVKLRVNAQRLSPLKGINKRIRVEIPNN